MTIAILAVQGAFAEHEAVLDRLGADWFEIRQKSDLDCPFDGLILPGGESTVMTRLMHDLDLYEPLRERIVQGMPVFGTCAGLILLAKDVKGGVPCFGTMDITVQRNAYGRQLGSFATEQEVFGLGVLPMTFIRAPYIVSAGAEAEVLATVDDKIVAARQGNQLVTAFHPELDSNDAIHAWFLSMTEEACYGMQNAV